MSFRSVRPFLRALFLVCSISLYGVVKEENLVVRWTFDEGNGSSASDVTGGGLDMLLSANAQWGTEDNDTAISKHSLNLMNGDSYARALAHSKLKASDSFSILMWFKSNGQPDAYSQMLSKKKDGYSSYFIQVEPDGKSLKTIVRSYGNYYDNGNFKFSLDKWHQLVMTFNGNTFNSFLDGTWVGTTDLTWQIDANDGELGVGGTADGSNLFKGWIDDLRIYDTALHKSEVFQSYGEGAGDFGADPVFLVDRATSTMPITATLSFWDSNQNPVQMSDLNVSDFRVSGATISNLQPLGLNYTFDLNASIRPQRVIVELPAGVCKDDDNISNAFGSVVVVYSDLVTKSEDLVGWWTFDDLNGSVVSDNSGAGSNAYLLGDSSLDATSPALGTKALLLDGDGDSAMVFGLKGNPGEIYRYDELELWWPLDGNYSDLSGNGRNATPTVNEANPWQDGRYGQAFTFTGNDHLEASNPLYRGITGTGGRTLSMWIKTTDKNWRTLAYWGNEVNGQRWWLRLYRNELQMHFRNSVRRTYTKNLIDGLWHHVAVVNPDGGNSRNTVRLYIDGAEADFYGQWGQTSISTGVNYSFRIGKRWNNGQRYVGAIDDVRLYSAGFSEFEIQNLVQEGSGLPVDMGEESYTLSVWAKPKKLSPVMDYKFAIGWYEGNGNNEYIQSRLLPGRVDVSEYNSMYVVNPSSLQQSNIFPDGLTERLFDGTFNDQQLNDTTGNPNQYDAGIDGRGFRFGAQIPTNNSIINRIADANFSVLTALPTESHSDSYILWEHGGTGTGAFVGFNNGFLRVRAGDGGANVMAPGSSSSSMALLDVSFSQLEEAGFTDGKLHDLRWEMIIGDCVHGR